MGKIKEDPVREERIIMEIVVDAYGEEERALGWYYYLDEALSFPFQAECIGKRSISPLKIGQKVTVIGMPSEDECEREIFVEIEWEDDTLSVPLSQLKGVKVDAETRAAIEDWQYWVDQGYKF
jgi:hypothetical protein